MKGGGGRRVKWVCARYCRRGWSLFKQKNSAEVFTHTDLQSLQLLKVTFLFLEKTTLFSAFPCLSWHLLSHQPPSYKSSFTCIRQRALWPWLFQRRFRLPVNGTRLSRVRPSVCQPVSRWIRLGADSCWRLWCIVAAHEIDIDTCA